VNQTRQGGDTRLDGSIILRNTQSTPVKRIRLFDMTPIAFPQFGANAGRRTMVIDLGRFDFAAP